MSELKAKVQIFIDGIEISNDIINIDESVIAVEIDSPKRFKLELNNAFLLDNSIIMNNRNDVQFSNDVVFSENKTSLDKKQPKENVWLITTTSDQKKQYCIFNQGKFKIVGWWFSDIKNVISWKYLIERKKIFGIKYFITNDPQRFNTTGAIKSSVAHNYIQVLKKDGTNIIGFYDGVTIYEPLTKSIKSSIPLNQIYMWRYLTKKELKKVLKKLYN